MCLLRPASLRIDRSAPLSTSTKIRVCPSSFQLFDQQNSTHQSWPSKRRTRRQSAILCLLRLHFAQFEPLQFSSRSLRKLGKKPDQSRPLVGAKLLRHPLLQSASQILVGVTIRLNHYIRGRLRQVVLVFPRDDGGFLHGRVGN